MKKFNIAYDVAFEVISANKEPTREEILAALKKRVKYLEKNLQELDEACCPFDTCEIEA